MRPGGFTTRGPTYKPAGAESGRDAAGFGTKAASAKIKKKISLRHKKKKKKKNLKRASGGYERIDSLEPSGFRHTPSWATICVRVCDRLQRDGRHLTLFDCCPR